MENRESKNNPILGRGFRWAFILCLGGLITITGCSTAQNKIMKTTPTVSSQNSATNKPPVVIDQTMAESYVTKAMPILSKGFKNGLADSQSIVKLEGVSFVQEGNKTWMWAGARAVDYVGTGSAVLLSSEDGGNTWIFVGRMQQYPTSLETQLKTAKVYDIQQYSQTSTNHKDANGIQIGDFLLSPEQITDLVAKVKLENWRTNAQELVIHQMSDFGFPTGTTILPENDYYTANIKGVTYYIFTKPVTAGTPAIYYIARISK